MRTNRALSFFAPLAGVASAFTTDGNAFGWRMPCDSFPEVGRLDPIVSPGKESMHAHRFFGSSRFHSNLTYANLRASECTSCRMAEDKSAYWVPPLYFKRADGKFETVPNPGGILVYYSRLDDEYEPFPEGFKMIAGDAMRKNSTLPFDDPWATSRWTAEDMTEEKSRERAVGFLCLHYKNAGGNEMAFGRHGMPSREFLAANCPDGLRVELAFPSCWSGKDLDSPNHRDHVAYDSQVHKGGKCPETHPIRLPSLIFETIYATHKQAQTPGEFVFAHGDKTGYGYHADFMNGWDPAFLKQAMEICKNNAGDVDNLPCNLLTKQDMGKCKAEKYNALDITSREVCAGVIDELCGSSEWDKMDHGHGGHAPPPTPAPAAEPLPVPPQPAAAPPADASAMVPDPLIVQVISLSAAPDPPARPEVPAPPAPMITPAPPISVTDLVVVTVYETQNVVVTETAYDKRRRHPHHVRRR